MEIQMATENDELILRVKSTSPPQSLASAISHGLYDSKKVVLRAIGAGPVNQAIKAIAIAQSYVGQRGLVIACRPGFDTVKMPDGDVSAIVIRVFTV